MQNAFQTAEAYKRQQIMTAAPEQLTLMLYNGAIKFINEAIKLLEAKEDVRKSNEMLVKAQNIVIEFMKTLNMKYEISHQLYSLYEYAYNGLVEGNMKNDVEKLQEVKGILVELRDTWKEAMKKAQQENAASK